MSRFARVLVPMAAVLIGSGWAIAQVDSPEPEQVASAVAGDEAAHGHDEAGVIATWKQGLPTSIASIIVFVIVLVVLSKTAWPRIVGGLEERARKIREEIDAAEDSRRQARDALEQYEKSLAEARSEAKKMLEETKVKQQALATELRAKADADLSEMRERATREIEAAKRAAVAEIYAEASNLSTAIAAKILGREVTAQDQKSLIEESIAELQAANA